MVDYGLVIYADVQILMMLGNFLLDYLLLWATAALTRTNRSWRRIAAGASVGTLYYTLYLMALWRLIPFYGTLRLLPAVVLVSVLMLATTFAPVPRRRFCSIGAHFYIVAFVAGGSGLAASQLLGPPGIGNPVAGMAAAAASTLLAAEVGWGVTQRRSWRHRLQIPLDISFGTSTTRIIALLDTGNHLKCPLSGVPVVVVEHRALAAIFPPHVAQAVAGMEEGDWSGVSRLLAAADWSARFRIIPFTSLGATNGLMVGFRPSGLTVWVSERPAKAPPCIIALSRQALDPHGAYQALVSPDLVEGSMVGVEATDPGYLASKEEYPHVVTHG